MSLERKQIAILGAGPAGLALALRLLRRDDLDAKVVVIDLKPYVGGLASSFEHEGLYFDYGSHRLHPATSPEIMGDIKALLGPDLLERPRHGRISLLKRFVKFPLNPINLATHLPPSFMLGFGSDLLSKPFRKKPQDPGSFAEALEAGLGQTICQEFYFPYARKLWGLKPEEISVIQAQKRVSADSVGKLIRKVLSLMPGFKAPGAGIFYYPKRGYGQISDAMADEVRRLGGEIRLSTRITKIQKQGDAPATLTMVPTDADNGEPVELTAGFVFSTIPVTVLAQLMDPSPPQAVRDAVGSLAYRAMVIHYLVLGTDQFTEYDAHYFPGDDIRFSRLSEPKNYSASSEPKGRTGLCFEIPCGLNDDIWNASVDEITEVVTKGMATAGLPIEVPIVEAFSCHVPQVYPTYAQGFEAHFAQVDAYLDGVPGILPLGRQALFAHDNTHHTMEMAYRASDCLNADLSWEADAWREHREAFDKHVVVD